jgi:hypothetical protein
MGGDRIIAQHRVPRLQQVAGAEESVRHDPLISLTFSMILDSYVRSNVRNRFRSSQREHLRLAADLGLTRKEIHEARQVPSRLATLTCKSVD